MAAPSATLEKPKTPSVEELLALIEKQGKQIAALIAKAEQAPAAEPVRAKPVIDLPAGPPWSIRVRALRRGFYPNPERNADGAIVRGTRHIARHGRTEDYAGDEFMIEKPEDFAGGPLGWMELAMGPAKPAPYVPPTPIARPVQDPLMAGILPTAATPQRTIES